MKKILGVTTASGNYAEVYVTGQHGRMLAIKCDWDRHPPSEADIAEINPIVHEYLVQAGLNMAPEAVNVVSTAPHEEVVQRFSRAINAENN